MTLAELMELTVSVERTTWSEVAEAYAYGIPYRASGSVSAKARSTALLSISGIRGRLLFTLREGELHLCESKIHVAKRSRFPSFEQSPCRDIPLFASRVRETI